MESFAEIYSRPHIVRQFDFDRLEFAEGEFLRALMRHEGDPDLLDLGIGAGRTTRFLAPLCGTYTGIDIAPGMVTYCRKTFATAIDGKGWSIEVGDGANLSRWADESFDFVLFSFNGLDCLSLADRERCLREIQRVLRPGGMLMFSSHNLQAIPTTYHADQPELTASRWAGIQSRNPPWAELATQPEAMFWDGVYGDDEDVRHIYIRPAHQVRVLEKLGFANTRVLQGHDGAKVGAEELDHAVDFSLYYQTWKPALNPAATESESDPT
ncbi:class I SAM-dependent methyltransferase [Actomonas aquatica]|uniref:Class I SAM-dependent methyltransferase n=1 Tax=Actomonas aquatica TaxID=2866162 RepID=A0ABZ1C615_9BACT|nr:class I SAM-dependent methyltransferase [Opitutus sp. WL0086]WRQ87178.1 class I SAM-dependent methyltransferase [Opitutus sp. WL0086]